MNLLVFCTFETASSTQRTTLHSMNDYATVLQQFASIFSSYYDF